MTQPSLVVDAIARTLLDELEPAVPSIDTPRVEVLATDVTDVDVGDSVTFADPAVIVSCTGLANHAADTGPMVLQGTFLARCYARQALGPADAGATRGDVAMDLAALVASFVEGTLWRGLNGEIIVFGRAEGVSLRNATTEAVVDKGRALWVVTWTQPMEFSRVDQGALLRSFRRLRATVEMGDASVPDVEVHVDMTGGMPP